MKLFYFSAPSQARREHKFDFELLRVSLRYPFFGPPKGLEIENDVNNGFFFLLRLALPGISGFFTALQASAYTVC